MFVACAACRLSQRTDGGFAVTRIGEERSSNQMDVRIGSGIDIGARQKLESRCRTFRLSERERSVDSYARNRPKALEQRVE